MCLLSITVFLPSVAEVPQNRFIYEPKMNTEALNYLCRPLLFSPNNSVLSRLRFSLFHLRV